MNSSGIKRGLAATAVSALAIAGLPLLASSASADTINDQVTALELVSQSSGEASVKNDGTDSTIRLQAVAPASITSVTFQYKIGADWQDIATVSSRNDDGAFSQEWAPTGAIIGANVDLRVIGTPTGGTQQADDVTGLTITPAGGAVATVNLAAGSALGVFQSPYGAGHNVIVNGTTSLASGAVALKTGDAITDAAASATPATVTPVRGATTGSFRGVLDISADYTYGATDQLLVGATVTGGSDHVEAYTLYKQAITTVTATASSTKVEEGGEATVTVTVVDQNGAPIAGARVTSSADATAVETTDAAGQATFDQGPSTAYYYADATNTAGYSAGAGDQKSADITVSEYVAAPATLSATSTDGAAFDRDEYAAGDLSVQVKDQEGANRAVPGQSLNYFWTVTPFDATAAPVRVPATGTSTQASSTAGRFDVTLPTGTPSGTYTLNAALGADALGNGAIAAAEVLSVKVGQASVVLTPAREQNVAAGGIATATGKVALEDGTVLANRSVDVTYAQGTTGSDSAKDAGIVPATGTGLVASRTFTTGADGTFEVKISDPAETPQRTELGGSLDAAAPALGVAATQVANVAINFISAAPIAGAVVTIAENTGENTPGTLVTGTATVAIPGAGGTSTPVVGQQVTVTLDKGHFVASTRPGAAVPAKTTIEAGDLVGDYLNIGTSRTLVTDADGEVSFAYTIGRDTGFDDDGKVAATLTAAAAGASDTEGVDFSSANPLNGGKVEIVMSPESVQRNAVAPALEGDRVYFDLFTTDQFGNRVGGEDVALSETAENFTLSSTTATSDFAADGDFYVTGTAELDAVVTAGWTTDTTTYTSAAGAVSTVVNGKTFTDTETVEYYAVDFAGSTFEMTSSAEGAVEIGTSVTETVKVVDQEGRPVAGASVEFNRNGAGGDATVNRTTNAAGVATYTFSVTEAGTVNVTALVTSGIQSETLTDTIEVEAAPVVVDPNPPVKITASITGANNGKKADKLTVKASNKIAAGAIVKLFKINAKGKQVLVDTDVLNANGSRVFTVADNNKAKKTKYRAVIVGSKSVHTKAKSNTKAVR
ncbi:hypothetical protein GHK92_07765 [Nocardioides sp. dk4132]|uniref:beta strand repeat-containing protein n=1 Tax=unclassified Nocardioides TaxID=2615069 RepID=UPI0012956CE6|nr:MULTISPECIES: Ig-like domain-containing protein [unclassified Nocardioides]MQW75766.1 hypothetical protein [Nocardioides sp. dk4132]QGA08648.1 hypothetical protein GFH29_15515 [Nocardioides sp. dk884]